MTRHSRHNNSPVLDAVNPPSRNQEPGTQNQESGTPVKKKKMATTMAPTTPIIARSESPDFRMEDLPEEDQHLQKLAEKRASKANQMESIKRQIQSLFAYEKEATRQKELEKMLISTGKLITAYSTGQLIHAEKPKPNPTPASADETKDEMKALRQQMQRIEASLEGLGERLGKKVAPVVPQKRSANQTEEDTTKSTYAEVAARGITQKGNIEVVIPVRKAILTQKKAEEVPEKNTTIHYKDRRLIIPMSPQKLEEFNPTSIRD